MRLLVWLGFGFVNRAASFFVVFCLLLLGIGALIIWWLGPHLVSLAFDSERANAPFYSLYLQHQSDPGSQDSGYNVRLLQLLAHPVAPALIANDAAGDAGLPGDNVEAPAQSPTAILWQTSTLSVLEGSTADEWSDLVVVRFDSGRQFVRLVTSPPYRQIRDLAPKGRRVVVGSATAPLGPIEHPAALLLLVEGGVQAALDSWVDQVVALGGDVIWDAPATVVESADAEAADWDSLLLIGFADSQALAAWSFSVEAQTTNALLNAKSQALNLWLLQDLR